MSGRGLPLESLGIDYVHPLLGSSHWEMWTMLSGWWLRSTFKSTILPWQPYLPDHIMCGMVPEWIYTGISPLYFHLSTCECSPLNLNSINQMAEPCVTNGPAKLVASSWSSYIKLYWKKLFSGQSIIFEPVPYLESKKWSAHTAFKVRDAVQFKVPPISHQCRPHNLQHARRCSWPT